MSVTAEWSVYLFYICKVLGSNLYPETNLSWRFSWFSSAPSKGQERSIIIQYTATRNLAIEDDDK
jgi:hypothetical protein